MTQPQPELLIEPAAPEDFAAIAEFGPDALGEGFTTEGLRRDAALSWSRLLVGRLAGGGIVAFCNYWIVADEVHILNVATRPEQRRRGYARRILERIIAEARAASYLHLTLEVRRGNVAAQELYHRLGFEPVGLRKNYYAEGNEDAVVMLLRVDNR
jgi:[ribosomal protein S18]-alanine N-acetyltransferase